MNENLIPNCLCLNQLLTLCLLCSPRILLTNIFKNPDCQKYWQLSRAEQHFPKQNCDSFKALCFGLWHIAWIPRIYSPFMNISDVNCTNPQWPSGYPSADSREKRCGGKRGWMSSQTLLVLRMRCLVFCFWFFCNVCVRSLVVKSHLNNTLLTAPPSPLVWRCWQAGLPNSAGHCFKSNRVAYITGCVLQGAATDTISQLTGLGSAHKCANECLSGVACNPILPKI